MLLKTNQPTNQPTNLIKKPFIWHLKVWKIKELNIYSKYLSIFAGFQEYLRSPNKPEAILHTPRLVWTKQ